MCADAQIGIREQCAPTPLGLGSYVRRRADWDSGAMCADALIGKQCAPTRRLGFGSNVRRRADWDSGAMCADALIGIREQYWDSGAMCADVLIGKDNVRRREMYGIRGAMCADARNWDSGAMCADAQIGIREQCAPTR
ncbi:unnamed protein product, partial [Mesorhabditis spiculigera]